MKHWNIQSEKDLFNEPVDWATTYYAVILKDGTECVVCTYADECADGSVNTYYEFVEDESDMDLDDILLWRAINCKERKEIENYDK